ncbi:hypothetical protein PROFUN_17142, partial [Planoprotostelium fungivorum]
MKGCKLESQTEPIQKSPWIGTAESSGRLVSVHRNLEWITAHGEGEIIGGRFGIVSGVAACPTQSTRPMSSSSFTSFGLQLDGNHCTLKDSSLCLAEAEANRGLLGGNLYTPPACLLNHKVLRQALLYILHMLVTIKALDSKYKLSHKVPGRQGWLGCFAEIYNKANRLG